MRTLARALTIVLAFGVAAPSGAASTADLLRCQKNIHSRAAYFMKSVQRYLLDCAVRVETCQLAQEIDGEDPTLCLAAATSWCSTASTKIPIVKVSSTGKVGYVCASVFLSDLDTYVAGLGFFHVSAGCGAATVNDLVACIFDQAQCAAERSVFQIDPRAQDALTAAGIAASHPCVAP